MSCNNCNAELNEGQKFCTKCGTEAKPRLVGALKPSVVMPAGAKPVPWATKRIKISIGVAIAFLILLILFALVSASENKSSSSFSAANPTASSTPQDSVVDILCDNGKSGSGTIFTSDGTIITNNHVIEGSVSCKITIPNQTTGQIQEIYEAAPIITPVLSQKYDVAAVKVDGAYTDSKGKSWGQFPKSFSAFVSPSTCDPSVPSKLGDSVRIFGYPVTSGGYNLTITDGVISSFADNGKILTSAQIDSGNSGGLAIDQDGCWLGIPSAVVAGNYQSLGVIIPGAIVQSFLSNVPVKNDPAANIDASARSISAEIAATPEETDDQKCQSVYGGNSVAAVAGTSGSLMCKCVLGFSWDATGNGCKAKSDLQNECVSRFGSGSYSYTESGKAVCGCMPGYQLNSNQTACIIPQTQNGYQVCSSQYANATWDGTYTSDGKYTCVCQTGYQWDSSSQSCIY